LKSFFQRRKLILVLKILIFLLLLWTVYEQAFRHQSFSHALQLFQQDISPFAILLLSFTIILMPVNWLLEAKKWQLLINKLEPISLWTSFKAILSGITLGVITPYRVGDYAGRLVVLRKAEPIQAVAVTVVGNFSQIIITVIAGLVSICSYFFLYENIPRYLLIFICIGSVLVFYLLVDLYFRINLTGNFLKRFSFYKKISRYIEVLEKYNHKELVSLLLFSAMRYAVFAAQYLFLLSMFGIQIQLLTGIILIGTLFIIQAVVPVELWIRGNLALFVFSSFSNNSLGILSASLVLWLINLIVPALAGSIVIFKNNGLKNSAV
jgi:uncharacterized membrane protein YbhN (UPF0104 family)